MKAGNRLRERFYLKRQIEDINLTQKPVLVLYHVKTALLCIELILLSTLVYGLILNSPLNLTLIMSCEKSMLG